MKRTPTGTLEDGENGGHATCRHAPTAARDSPAAVRPGGLHRDFGPRDHADRRREPRSGHLSLRIQAGPLRGGARRGHAAPDRGVRGERVGAVGTRTGRRPHRVGATRPADGPPSRTRPARSPLPGGGRRAGTAPGGLQPSARDPRAALAARSGGQDLRQRGGSPRRVCWRKRYRSGCCGERWDRAATTESWDGPRPGWRHTWPTSPGGPSGHPEVTPGAEPRGGRPLRPGSSRLLPFAEPDGALYSPRSPSRV